MASVIKTTSRITELTVDLKQWQAILDKLPKDVFKKNPDLISFGTAVDFTIKRLEDLTKEFGRQRNLGQIFGGR